METNKRWTKIKKKGLELQFLFLLKSIAITGLFFVFFVITRARSQHWADSGGGRNNEAEFRPFVPGQVEASTRTIGDDVLLSDFSNISDRDNDAVPLHDVGRAVSQTEIDIKTDNLTPKRDDRMNDEWWSDPNKPTVENVQNVDNSKLMEVRVLPPKEFLENLKLDEEDPSRRERAMAVLGQEGGDDGQVVFSQKRNQFEPRHEQLEAEPRSDEFDVEAKVDRVKVEPMQYRVLVDPSQERAKLEFIQGRSSNLGKQSRALDDGDVRQQQQPKLTKEMLIKILTSFGPAKTSKLAKIFAEHNIKIQLDNVKVERDHNLLKPQNYV